MADELSADAASCEDPQLVASLARGNPQALAALYDRHAPSMLGLAQGVLGERRDAEDLVHDVFLEAWRRAARYDAGRGSVRTWLLVMTRSRALDRRRALSNVRRRDRESAQRDLGIAPTHVEADGLRGIDRARALAAIATLPERQRRVVELRCLEGLSCREIAERCGLPRGTVKSRLVRALQRLREQLGDAEGLS